eukprot:SM003935S15175  [mRNA]  locus=s3935:176:448:- [translate_table: standard]
MSYQQNPQCERMNNGRLVSCRRNADPARRVVWCSGGHCPDFERCEEEHDQYAVKEAMEVPPTFLSSASPSLSSVFPPSSSSIIGQPDWKT